MIARALDAADCNLDSVQDFNEAERLAAMARAWAEQDADLSLATREELLLRVHDVLGRAKAGRGDVDGAREEWSCGLTDLAPDFAGPSRVKVRAQEALLRLRLGQHREAARIAAELPADDAVVRRVHRLLEEH